MPSENTLKDAHKVNEPKILNSWILLNAPCNIRREKLIWLKELRDIPQLGCVALGYLGDFVTMDERLEIKAAPWKKLKADLHVVLRSPTGTIKNLGIQQPTHGSESFRERNRT